MLRTNTKSTKYEHYKDKADALITPAVNSLQNLEVEQRRKVITTYKEAFFYSLEKMENASLKEKSQNIDKTYLHLQGPPHCPVKHKTGYKHEKYDLDTDDCRVLISLQYELCSLLARYAPFFIRFFTFNCNPSHKKVMFVFIQYYS